MVRKIFFLVILLVALFIGARYWKSYRGLVTSNLPSKEKIADLIPGEGETIGPGVNSTGLPLKIPDGYTISIFAKDLDNPRDLVLDPGGVVLTSITSGGKVVAIFNGSVETVTGGLNRPHGLAFNGSKLYIAETNQVAVYDYDLKLKKAINKRKIIDLPAGGGHFTRSLLIRDDKLYVSIGSSCNVCEEEDKRRAAVWVSNLDGSDFKPFATGLRNAVFMALNPVNNDIWVTEMGRDNLGDDLPPEEINVLKEGKFYGWPYCWGNRNPDKDLNPQGTKFDCTTSENPHITFQAHSAPLGLAFLGSDLLVAYHGSWNRSIPTGYKVVRFTNGVASDFITGWQSGSEILGRPADILVDGEKIYVSDDKAGVVYLLKPL